MKLSIHSIIESLLLGLLWAIFMYIFIYYYRRLTTDPSMMSLHFFIILITLFIALGIKKGRQTIFKDDTQIFSVTSCFVPILLYVYLGIVLTSYLAFAAASILGLVVYKLHLFEVDKKSLITKTKLFTLTYGLFILTLYALGMILNFTIIYR